MVLKYWMGSRKHLGTSRWKRARKGLLQQGAVGNLQGILNQQDALVRSRSIVVLCQPTLVEHCNRHLPAALAKGKTRRLRSARSSLRRRSSTRNDDDWVCNRYYLQHMIGNRGPAQAWVQLDFTCICKAVASVQGQLSCLIFPVGTHHVLALLELAGLNEAQTPSRDILTFVLGTVCCRTTTPWPWGSISASKIERARVHSHAPAKQWRLAYGYMLGGWP